MRELVYPRLLIPRVEQFPDKVAIIDVTAEGTRYRGTFADHLDRLLRLVNSMPSVLGVEPGDRFAVLAMNSHEYLELYHAAMFGAGIINPLNMRLSPSELAYVLNDSGSRVVFTDPVFAPLLDQARAAGATVEKVVIIGGESGDGKAGSAGGTVGYEDLLSLGKPVMPPEPEEGDAAVLMYTGGTTGFPKGALLEQRAEVLNVYHVLSGIGLREDRRFLFQSPMFHAALVAGVLGIPATGATSVTIPLFDPALVLRTIEEQQIDTTMVIPIMLSMLERSEGFSPERLRSLRQLVYGASPISQDLIAEWLKMLPDTEFIQGYGMTEAASALTFLGPEDHRRGGDALTAAGRPLFGVELCITDSLGNALARGVVGEVCARGGNLMREYWRKPEETEAVMRDGWYRTGDMGFLDDGNLLHLTDRMKDMIVTGGENVYSIEVENAIASHPAVAEVAVIGIPSDKWGESVHAVVVLRQGMKATAEDVIEHTRLFLAGFKVPRSVEFQDDPLPMSGAFKPLKRELRRRYWQNQDRQVN
ncbi:MAG: AMP-binding protein [Acidimicrobiales bacterium]|jgi:long-chain acyl-CoA synthetase